MKKLFPFAAALALIAFCAPAQAKKVPFDFLPFRGVYNGTASLLLSGATYFGTAQIIVTAPKNGRSASMTVSGVIVAGGSALPITNAYTFTSAKTFTQQDLTYQLIGTTGGTSGSYAAKKNKVTFTAPFNVMGTVGTTSGSFFIRPQGKKHQVLTLNSFLIFNGMQEYTFTFTVSKKVKPPKK